MVAFGVERVNFCVKPLVSFMQPSWLHFELSESTFGDAAGGVTVLGPPASDYFAYGHPLGSSIYDVRSIFGIFLTQVVFLRQMTLILS